MTVIRQLIYKNPSLQMNLIITLYIYIYISEKKYTLRSCVCTSPDAVMSTNVISINYGIIVKIVMSITPLEVSLPLSTF